jgi:hypothetical protein
MSDYNDMVHYRHRCALHWPAVKGRADSGTRIGSICRRKLTAVQSQPTRQRQQWQFGIGVAGLGLNSRRTQSATFLLFDWSPVRILNFAQGQCVNHDYLGIMQHRIVLWALITVSSGISNLFCMIEMIVHFLFTFG